MESTKLELAFEGQTLRGIAVAVGMQALTLTLERESSALMAAEESELQRHSLLR